MNAVEKSYTPLTPAPVIQADDLKEYVALKATSKDAEASLKVLNARIKNGISQLFLDNASALIEEYQDKVEAVLALEAEAELLAPDEAVPVKLQIKGMYTELNEVGITQPMIQAWTDHNGDDLLKRQKADFLIDGYKVTTTIQDRSKMNEEKAIAYLKSKGLQNLIATKEVLDEAALEVAIYEHKVDVQELQRVAVEENFVVALSVKKASNLK